MTYIGHVAVVAFPLAMILAGTGDVLTRRIPNLFVFVLAIGFVPLASASGLPWSYMTEHFVTAAALLAVGYGLFCLGYLGGGDAKLLAVVGLWLGFAPSLLFVLYSALAGGVLAAGVGFLFITRLEAAAWGSSASRFLHHTKPDVPIAYAFAVGAILATPYSWMTAVASAPTLLTQF